MLDSLCEETRGVATFNGEDLLDSFLEVLLIHIVVVEESLEILFLIRGEERLWRNSRVVVEVVRNVAFQVLLVESQIILFSGRR